MFQQYLFQRYMLFYYQCMFVTVDSRQLYSCLYGLHCDYGKPERVQFMRVSCVLC